MPRQPERPQMFRRGLLVLLPARDAHIALHITDANDLRILTVRSITQWDCRKRTEQNRKRKTPTASDAHGKPPLGQFHASEQRRRTNLLMTGRPGAKSQGSPLSSRHVAPPGPRSSQPRGDTSYIERAKLADYTRVESVYEPHFVGNSSSSSTTL
jgi:hypothetical protein